MLEMALAIPASNDETYRMTIYQMNDYESNNKRSIDLTILNKFSKTDAFIIHCIPSII